jgi:hypothetical protein
LGDFGNWIGTMPDMYFCAYNNIGNAQSSTSCSKITSAVSYSPTVNASNNNKYNGNTAGTDFINKGFMLRSEANCIKTSSTTDWQHYNNIYTCTRP